MEDIKKPSNPRLRNLDGQFAYEARQEDCVTLRDEIAMRAIQGHLASEYGAGIHCDNENQIYIARAAYSMADAMLKVREETLT